MENITIKLKSKIMSVGVFALYALLSILSLCSYILLCVFGSENPTPVLPFFFFMATQFICSIPQVNLRQITFDESSITIQRYIFKPTHLLFSSLQYSKYGVIYYNGYSIDLNYFENKNELIAAFDACQTKGLIVQNNKQNGKEIAKAV